MWNCRAAFAALFFFVGGAQAQVQMSKGCLKYPQLVAPSGSMPAVAKFFAEFQLWPDPGRPSKVEVVYSNLSQPQQAHLVAYLESVRWTCPDMPAAAQRTLEWSWVGNRRAEFNEPKVTLSRFLARMKEVPGERVNFDLDAMGCPFIVEWRSFRPAALNRAKVISAAEDPRQEPLLRWLASLEVDVPDATQAQLIGESMQISIPCGRINLAPPAGAASSSG